MKNLFLIALVLVGFGSVSAQAVNPVSWTFTSKKVSEKEYELQMIATIQRGWHLYSQVQPEDAIAQPTSFSFNKNPLLELSGKIKEVGKLEKYKDKKLDISANQYSDKVTFV